MYAYKYACYNNKQLFKFCIKYITEIIFKVIIKNIWP